MKNKVKVEAESTKSLSIKDNKAKSGTVMGSEISTIKRIARMPGDKDLLANFIFNILGFIGKTPIIFSFFNFSITVIHHVVLFL